MQNMHAGVDASGSKRERIHASYFFDFYDEEFVFQAYTKLLRRRPDPSGNVHYLNRIRSGESRYRILNDLSRSSEGRGGGVELQGMLPYRCTTFANKVPVVGRLVQAAIFLWRINTLMKDLRALENHLYRLSAKAGKL